MPDARAALVVVSEDPRTSHRAHEAIRIALGLVAGELDVTLVLTGPAVHLLDDDTDELVDGDEIARVRASLRRLGVPFHVEAAAIPVNPSWNPDGHPIVPVSPAALAALAARATRFLVF